MNSTYRLFVGHRAILGFSQVRGLKRPPVNTSQLKEGRRVGALGMKIGMFALWDKWGIRIPVTAVQLDACQVVQVKTEENEGYTAMQLGVGEAKLRRVKVPQLGHYRKGDLTPNRKLSEFRVTPDALLPVGTKILATHFVPGQLVDVRGVTKGKGFQGVMKKWGMSGGRATHGNSLSHRVGGSTGNAQDPGRVFKGKKMAGRMGNKNFCVQNLKIVKLDPEKNVIFVRGAVPGNKGEWVKIVDAVKGPFFPKPPPFPTSTGEEYVNCDEQDLWAPVPAEDPLKFKTPEDLY